MHPGNRLLKKPLYQTGSGAKADNFQNAEPEKNHKKPEPRHRHRNPSEKMYKLDIYIADGHVESITKLKTIVE